MPSRTLRLVCWNLEWCPLASSRSSRGKIADALIAEQEPDLTCLTESRLGWFPEGQGDVAVSEPVPASHNMHRHGGRKIQLWSRWGWEDVDPVGSEDIRDLFRFVAATTISPAGPVRVVGVVIPYRDSNVTHGRKDRARWDDHRRYLDALEDILDSRQLPTIVVGDFNQRHPYDSGYIVPAEVHGQLLRSLGDLEIATAGPAPGLDHALIDHVAVSEELKTHDLQAWPAVQNGTKISDHPGFRLDLQL